MVISKVRKLRWKRSSRKPTRRAAGCILRGYVWPRFTIYFWSAPASSFRITHYKLTRNGADVGTKDGTFTTYFEQIAGTYSYGISAVDVAGNVGAEAVRDISVNQPPDYVMQDVIASTFTGTIVSGVVESSRLLICVDDDETWEDHFVDNSYDTIQEQLDAGYDYYLEPCNTSGSYTEVFDFGQIYTNVITNVNYSIEHFDGDVDVTCKIRTSEDNINWTSQTTASTVCVESFRYLEADLEFAGAATDFSCVSDLAVRIDVKREADSGTVSASSGDSSGTEVQFGKSFKDVDSITLSVNNTNYRIAIYDFVDVPNPTSFKVLVYDQYGNRTSDTVTCIARGII